MLTTPHVLVGAAIGSQLPHAWQIVPLAAASHFVLDSIPHIQGYIEVEDLEKKEALFLLADAALAFGALFLLAKGLPNWEPIVLGGFSAVIPDFHHIYRVLFGPEKLSRYTKLHKKFHWKKNMPVLPGMATQILTIILAIFVIIKFI